MFMKTSTLRLLHRWIGLACAVAVLVAAGSGILHVVMTWTQSPPPRAQPSENLNAAAVRIAPDKAVARLGGRALSVQALSLRTIGGAPWYQVIVEGSPLPRYLNAIDGHEDSQADQRYAAEIASRSLGGVPCVGSSDSMPTIPTTS
jgi:hypothetical protein